MPAGGVQGGTWASSKWYNETQNYIGKHGDTLKTLSFHKYARSSCHAGVVTQVSSFPGD